MGKASVKYLSKVLGHDVLPEQLQYQWFHKSCLMMAEESAVEHDGPKSPKVVQVDMIHIIFLLIKPFNDPSCPVEGGIVILSH